ncbi:PREDICTED: uncharacterized protein LOC104702699 isoform X2 [Camelina sativa]|nr:PREDICTED: uncharacterized protein LOC104702699 isoform X2 [Camelina sativa]
MIDKRRSKNVQDDIGELLKDNNVTTQRSLKTFILTLVNSQKTKMLLHIDVPKTFSLTLVNSRRTTTIQRRLEIDESSEDNHITDLENSTNFSLFYI